LRDSKVGDAERMVDGEEVERQLEGVSDVTPMKTFAYYGSQDKRYTPPWKGSYDELCFGLHFEASKSLMRTCD